MCQGGEAAQIKSDAEAYENYMIIAIEVFLSCGKNLITDSTARKLFQERRVPKEIVQRLNDKYSEFYLEDSIKWSGPK